MTNARRAGTNTMENQNEMERRTAAAEELKSKGVGSGDLVLLREWACVGHGPTLWALGTKYAGTLSNIAASVERQPDGNWNWLAGRESGIRPSRETAMEACEAALQNTKVSNSGANT